VVGDSSSNGSTAGSSAGQSATGSGSTDPSSGATTSGDNAILGGTQVIPAVGAPVTASGDAVSVIGDSSSGGASGGATSGSGGGTGGGSVGGIDTGLPAVTTSGDQGILGGSQIAPAVSAPITVGGDAVSVIGDSSTMPGDPGSGGGSGGGSVGGVETFPPTTSTAALSVQALAETGVAAVPVLALGILLLMAGIGVMLHRVAARR